MKLTSVKNRGMRFTHSNPDWELHLYVIRGNRFNYVVDTGLGSLNAEPVREYIQKDSKPVIVINTHHHWDHIWGNASWQGEILVSHRLCREFIESEWDGMMQKNGRYCQGAAAKHLPNLVFNDTLSFPEDGLTLFHTPGHTADSISIWDEADRVLYAGDNIGDSPDEPVPSLYAGMEHYIRTLNLYQELDFDTCLSGHNSIMDKSIIGKILSLVER